jgi:hypothetical protein
MKTITFKATEEEVRLIRQNAKQEHVSVSEYLRRRALDKGAPISYEKVKCEFTGAEILKPVGALPPLTNETVREILADFP